MERYSSRGIDELNRLVLHSEIRKILGFEEGDNVSLLRVDTIVILQKADGDLGEGYFASQVDEFGRIVLPAELQQQMGWEVKSRVAVYHTDNILILQSA